MPHRVLLIATLDPICVIELPWVMRMPSPLLRNVLPVIEIMAGSNTGLVPPPRTPTPLYRNWLFFTVSKLWESGVRLTAVPLRLNKVRSAVM